MPKATPKGGAVEKMRAIQVNPIAVIVVALVIAAGLGYVFWLRPNQEAERIKQEWTTPEAAKARAPGGKKVDPSLTQLREQLLQKERGGMATSGATSSRDR